MSKSKWANIHLTLEQALNVLDIDRQLNVSYASDKRGAIRIIRKALEEKGAVKPKHQKAKYLITYYAHYSFGDMVSHCVSNNPFISNRIKLRFENPAVYKCEIVELGNTRKIIYSGNSWEELVKLGEKYVKE